MSVKVIYIAGVPASGKTTLFKRIRERLFSEATEFKFGKCLKALLSQLAKTKKEISSTNIMVKNNG